MDETDDFEEVSKARALAPCTVRCVEARVRNGRRRGVTLTFRCALLDRDVVEVLSAARLSVSYSPSQRALRLRADDRGQFQLSRAPRSEDVFLLRFPYRDDRMPWVSERVDVEVDVNVGQRAVFVSMPDAAGRAADTSVKQAEATPATPTPPPARPADGERLRLQVPEDVGGVTLTPVEASLLTLLSDGVRRSKAAVTLSLGQQGYGTVSLAAVLGRTRQKLDVAHTFSTDGQQVWLNVWEVDKLRRLVEGGGR